MENCIALDSKLSFLDKLLFLVVNALQRVYNPSLKPIHGQFGWLELARLMSPAIWRKAFLTAADEALALCRPPSQRSQSATSSPAQPSCKEHRYIRPLFVILVIE